MKKEITEMNTFDKVKSVIVESLNCDEALVTPEARLVEDLGADSLDAVELIMAMEEAFDVEIADDACNMTFEEDAATQMQTVGDIVSYIDAHQ